METNKKRGNLYLKISGILYIIFMLGLVIFGLFGNTASRYVLSLFGGQGDVYLAALGAVLFPIFILGLVLSEKAKKYLERNLISKIISGLYWFTIIAVLLAIIGFIIFFIMMIISGSFM